jgi:hypothetical protein
MSPADLAGAGLTTKACRTQSGYALLEMLVSTAIACAVIGVLLRFCAVAHTSVRTQDNVADLQQRLRVAVEALRRDLLAAGVGPSNGLSRAPLAASFAPILPGRVGLSGADPELTYRTDRISLISVALSGSQTRLVAAMSGSLALLRIDGAAPGCPAGNVCGFAAGDRALIYRPQDGDGAYDIFTVAAADPGLAVLTAAPPLARAYAAGSRVVGVTERIYYLDRTGRRLMVYDGDRSDVPVVDHVVDLRFTYFADPSPSSVPAPAAGRSNCAYAAGDPPVPLLANLGGTVLTALTPSQLTDGPACGRTPNRFDADLLRVRRIGVALRLEAEAAEFRGFGPAFFARGTSLDGTRYIPDIQLTFDVSPRNMTTAAGAGGR